MTVHRTDEHPAEITLSPVDTLLAELEEFADACAGGAAFRVHPEEAIHTVAVMQAMAASAERGEAVTLNTAHYDDNAQAPQLAASKCSLK